MFHKLLCFLGLSSALAGIQAEADAALRVFSDAKDRLVSLRDRIDAEAGNSSAEILKHQTLISLLSCERQKAVGAIEKLEALINPVVVYPVNVSKVQPDQPADSGDHKSV